LLARTAQSRRVPGPVPFEVIRRARVPRWGERTRVQGVLVAPSRARSVGVTQGAFAGPGLGLTFPASDGLGTCWWVDVTVTDIDPATLPTDPYTTAVTAGRRVPVVVVRADWDHDGYHSPLTDLTGVVTAVTIDRAAVGDLPDEASLIEGTTIAQATVVLEGEFGDSTVFEVLAPYRSDSPLYRSPVLTTPVTVSAGFLTSTGPVLFPQLTGHIRAIKPVSGDRTVEVTVLDPADQLRAPITLPAYGMARSDYLASNHKFYINSQAVIDYILRKNGVYASVAPHPDAQIACTGHGWFAAEQGRNAVPRGIAGVITSDQWWVPGPFDLLAVRGVWSGNAAYTEFFAREPYTPVPGTGVGMAAWVKFGNDLPVPAGENRLVFQLLPLNNNAAFQFNMRVFADGGFGGFISVNGVETGFAQPVATPATWMYLGLHFQHNTDGTTSIRYRQNRDTTGGSVTTPILGSPTAPYMQCTAWTYVGWSDFHCWYSYDPPDDSAWPGETPVLAADLDPGLNLMTHLPDVVNADSWKLISEVAAAEYGLVGFDAAGRFFFRSRNSATIAQASIEENITTGRALIDLVTNTTTDAVRNIITTETSAGFMTYNNVIYESPGASQFDTPQGTSVYQVPLPYSAIGPSTQEIPQQLTGSWGPSILWGYVAVQATNPTVEIDVADDLSVLFTMTGDRTGKLTVRNNTAFVVRFATVSGEPALRVVGWQLDPTPVAVEYTASQGSVETYGLRMLPVTASPWRQLLSSMRPVALRLLAELAWPVPVIDQVTAVGDPAREVGDTVQLVDPGGHGSIRATVVKISRSVSAQGVVDTLTVRPFGPPGVFLLDDPITGVLDSTVYWITP
jgi:hypothetical protein